MVHGPRGDEQIIRQAIEIGKHFGIDRALAVGGDAGALGPPHRRPRDMERRRRRMSAGQHEAGERRQIGIECVDRLFKLRYLAGDDPQRAGRRREIIARRRQIGAQIEQIVLDQGERGSDRIAGLVGNGDADRRIGLVDLADRRQPQRILGDARAIDQPRRPGVAGAGIDAVELDQDRLAGAIRRRAG